MSAPAGHTPDDDLAGIAAHMRALRAERDSLRAALELMLIEAEIMSGMHPMVAKPGAGDRWPTVMKTSRAALGAK